MEKVKKKKSRRFIVLIIVSVILLAIIGLVVRRANTVSELHKQYPDLVIAKKVAEKSSYEEKITGNNVFGHTIKKERQSYIEYFYEYNGNGYTYKKDNSGLFTTSLSDLINGDEEIILRVNPDEPDKPVKDEGFFG